MQPVLHLLIKNNTILSLIHLWVLKRNSVALSKKWSSVAQIVMFLGQWPVAQKGPTSSLVKSCPVQLESGSLMRYLLSVNPNTQSSNSHDYRPTSRTNNAIEQIEWPLLFQSREEKESWDPIQFAFSSVSSHLQTSFANFKIFCLQFVAATVIQTIWLLNFLPFSLQLISFLNKFLIYLLDYSSFSFVVQ